MICYNERNPFFCTLYGVWGDDFIQKIQIQDFFFNFKLLHLKFKKNLNLNLNLKKLKKLLLSKKKIKNLERSFYCSRNLKRQSERSELRPDTSSLVTIKNELMEFTLRESVLSLLRTRLWQVTKSVLLDKFSGNSERFYVGIQRWTWDIS